MTKGSAKKVHFHGRIKKKHVRNIAMEVVRLIFELEHSNAEQERLQKGLHREKQFLSSIITSSRIGIWEWNVETGEVMVNDCWAEIIGYASNDVTPLSFESLLKFCHPEDFYLRLKLFDENLVSENKTYDFEYRMRHKNGSYIWVLEKGHVLLNAHGELIISGLMQDITERKFAQEMLMESEKRFRTLSVTDELTQLHNVRHFYEQLSMELQRISRHWQEISVILMDVDNFKKFNDNYGHFEGDKVLSRLGKIIACHLRQTDSGYRYGGEEFIVLLPMTNCDSACVIAERIRMNFENEIFFPNRTEMGIHVTLSIGIAQYQKSESMENFLMRADGMMYQAKLHGKNRICF